MDNSGAIAVAQARASAISGQISKLSASLAQTSAIINDLIVQISAIDGNSSEIFSDLNKEISDYIKSLINLNDTFNNPLLEKALINTTSIPAVLGFINRNIENDKGFADYIKSVAMAGGSSINAIIQGIKFALNSGTLDKKSISASAMAISPAALSNANSIPIPNTFDWKTLNDIINNIIDIGKDLLPALISLLPSLDGALPIGDILAIVLTVAAGVTAIALNDDRTISDIIMSFLFPYFSLSKEIGEIFAEAKSKERSKYPPTRRKQYKSRKNAY